MVMPLPSPNNTDKAPTKENAPMDVAILELLASRICHDLISPVGAVHNGVEFLEEMGMENSDEAVSLIAHSAQMAAARLQAFRLVYGAGGHDPSVKPENVHKIFDDLITADGKIKQDWDPHGKLGFKETPPGFCKMLMGTMMLAQESLPKGGTISVSAGEKEHTLITATGDGTIVREGVDKALARTIETDNLDPRLVHPYAISILACHYGFEITISEQKSDRTIFSLSHL